MDRPNLPPLDENHFVQLWESVAPTQLHWDESSTYTSMVSALPLFLGKASFWVWHSTPRVFCAVSMPTAQGVRWGLPNGEVSSQESEVLDRVSKYLGPDYISSNPLRDPKLLPHAMPPFGKVHFRPDLHYSLGAGLILEAVVPSSQLAPDPIIQVLADFSCHPYWGKRIVSDLIENGVRPTTVMARLISQLPEITRALAPLGVLVYQTWAKPGAGNSDLPQEVDPSYSAHLPPR